MGRKPRIQTGLRLDNETIDQLRKSGRALSDEIRDRLERTFKEDAIDPATRELQHAVAWLADEVSRQSDVAWQSNPNAQAALAAAIQTWLEITAPPWQGAVSDLFGPGDPATLGRSIARHYQRFKAEVEETHPEILRRRRIGSAVRGMRAKPEGEKP
jgi:hypothetical protein